MLSSLLALPLVVSLSSAPAGPSPLELSRSASPEPARSVTLKELLSRARRQGPEPRRAKARISLGAAAVAAARPILPANPQVYVGAGARNNRLGTRFEIQAQITQALEIAREPAMRRRWARAERRAKEREHQRAQWTAEVETRAAFHLAVLERRRAEMAAEVEAFSRKVRDDTARLVETGAESPLRLRLVEAELSQAEQARLRAEYEYRAACNRLARLAGWDPGEPIRPRGELPRPTVLPESVDARRVLDDHPTVKAARAQVQAAKARRTSARRDAFPNPQIGLYAARENPPGAAFPDHVALATVSIPLPLFRRNPGPRAEARAALEIARTEMTVAQRNLALDLERSIDAVNTDADRLRAYTDEIMPQFSENLRLVQRAFELGEIDLLEVFVARERFLELQHQALDVYRDYIESVRDLELAAGMPISELRGA